jgi:hypothetical protein
VSRSRQLSPLPEGLPPTVRTLLRELRLLKDRSGYDLRELASKTHASRSSWGRWLSGETWIPREAVVSMAELCGSDPGELGALWQRAEDERRARQLADPSALDGELAGEALSGRVTTARPPNTVAAAGAILHLRPVPSVNSRPARPRRNRAVFVGAVLGSALVAGVAGLLVGLSLREPPAEPAHTPWLTRQEILVRVGMWHPHSAQRIPYSQSGSYLGYRTDGSGYASMAIGLPAPGPNSGELASSPYTRRIAPGELLPGDLIIDPTGGAGARQVAVFEKWADPTHTRYWVYQQRRGYGTDHLVLSYPLDARSEYHPYRPLNIHGAGAPSPA